jgi:hypothetical protein
MEDPQREYCERWADTGQVEKPSCADLAAVPPIGREQLLLHLAAGSPQAIRT